MFFEDVAFQLQSDPFDYENGFQYGNMFPKEYIPYKNYDVPEVVPTSEKGDLLLKIYQYDFAVNDLSLYLDLNPNDSSIYSLFQKYTEELKMYIDVYESKYGPLELDHSDANEYMWYHNPWPWDKEGSHV